MRLTRGSSRRGACGSSGTAASSASPVPEIARWAELGVRGRLVRESSVGGRTTGLPDVLAVDAVDGPGGPGFGGRAAHLESGDVPTMGSPPRVAAPGHGSAWSLVACRAGRAGTSTAGRPAHDASATARPGSRRIPTSAGRAAAATTPPAPSGQPVGDRGGSPGGAAPPPDAEAPGSPSPWPHRRGRSGSTSAGFGAAAGTSATLSWLPSCRPCRRRACVEPQVNRDNPIFEPHTVRICPVAGDQPPMPTQDRGRSDQPVRRQRPGQEPDQRGERRAVGPVQPRLRVLPAQDRVLVAQYQDLRIFGRTGTGEESKPAGDAAERKVEQA
jgi:hypothetical protein